MRVRSYCFASINPRVFATLFAVCILTAFTSANAQSPTPGLGGGFETDGNLFSNSPGGGDDWLDGPAGPGTGVLNADGTPKDPATTLHVLDRTGSADLDVFDGSHKVFANPNTYKWKAGSAPQKDDIQNGLVHFSEDNDGNHWMRIAGDRRSINGESYIDYEFLQATLTKNANGTFSSGGPHGGRTIGDVLLTIHLTQGGSQADFFAQRWEAVGAGYDYVTTPFPAGTAFVAANIDSTISSTYPVFGVDTYGINQFGEASVNLDALLPNFGTCFGIATVFVRTKSSTSSDAGLKDFIEPFQVNMCLDWTPPVLDVPGDVTLACDQSTLTSKTGLATATDACDTDVDVSFVDTITPGSCAKNYTIERVWTATDDCGNTNQATQIITMVDDQAPVVTAKPADITIQCAGDIPAPDPNAVIVTGECSQVTVQHISDVSNGQTCRQVITRLYRATDVCGNATDVTQTITIDDTTKPTVGTLGPITVQCLGDVPAANIALVTASDNCGTPVVTHLSDVSNGEACPQVITRTYRVTDACGNVTDRTQLITIDDTTAPTVGVIQPVSVGCRGDVPAPNIAIVSASDNCSTPVVTHLSDVSNGMTCPEIITRTYRVADACGNTTDRQQRITVGDDTPPNISGPADVTVSCVGNIPAADTALITADDDCGTPTVMHVGDVSDGKTCPQVITRRYRATDACGNASDFVQKITVDDKTPPQVSPLPDLNLSCWSQVPTPDTRIVQASDGCGPVYVSHLGDQSDGRTCGATITRSYRVLDACGNATTVVQKIKINDQDAPVITQSPGPITVACVGDVPAANLGSVKATDNCGTATITFVGDQSDGNTCPQKITRTYRATDTCGNATTVTQIITVDDDEAPVMSACSANRTLECPSDVAFDVPTATDNCDRSPTVAEVETKTVYGPESWTYRVTKTFQAFDDCGNASQRCSQTLSIHCKADHLCSFTQGAYGSYGGYFNGMTTLELVQSLLLNNPLVVGKPGRSLTINYNGADCLIQRMPGNTTPSMLPAFGDKTLNTNKCQVPGQIPIPLNSGKFESVLLGQTIALTLNSRISPAMPLFPLTHQFCTQRALPGKDGLLGTADDQIDPNGVVKTFTIPTEVLRALDNLALPRIVYGLIELCNLGLAGQPTGGATLSQINNAATAINEGFDGCRFIVSCTLNEVTTGGGERIGDVAAKGASPSNVPTRFELHQNVPNPFNPSTTIRLALPEATEWNVMVYDVAGRLVRRLEGRTDGAAYVDARWDGTDNNGRKVSSGVYLYRVHAGQFVDVKRMVLFK